MQNAKSVIKERPLPVLSPGLLLTPDFPPAGGGISNYLFNIYSSFDLSQITLIAPWMRGSEEFDSAQLYKANRFPQHKRIPGLRGVSYFIQTYQRAKEIIRREPSLTVHCGHIHAAFVAQYLKRQFGTPYLVWTHALEIMDRLLVKIIRSSLGEADLVLTNSDYTRSYIESLGVSPCKIVKIRPSTDPKRFMPTLDARDFASSIGVLGRPVLLTVGNLNSKYRYKGQDMVIRSLPKVLKEVPDLLYVIAGEGSDTKYLQKLAEGYGVKDCVKLIGRVSDADLPFLYNCCDAFIMCSREKKGFRGTLAEGFGIVFLEASATAKLVIGGLSGGVPDAVIDGVTGILVDPTDPDAIAKAIVRVFTDRGLAQKLGCNGRRWVEEEMNRDRAAKEFQEAFFKFFPSQQLPKR